MEEKDRKKKRIDWVYIGVAAFFLTPLVLIVLLMTFLENTEFVVGGVGVVQAVLFRVVVTALALGAILFCLRRLRQPEALAAARRGDAANPKKESSGSQFYIVQDANTCAQLDGQYTVFGETVSGFDVIDKIAAVQTDGRDKPVKDIHIISIRPDRSTLAALEAAGRPWKGCDENPTI